MSRFSRLILLSIALLLSGCRVDLYHALAEQDANQMLALLMLHHIDADKQRQEGGGITLRVEQKQFIDAVELLRLNGYPHRKTISVETLFPANQLVVSPAEEQQKIIYLKEQRIEEMLSQMEGVIHTDVAIAASAPDDDQSGTPASVAVFIKYSPQVNLEALRVQITGLVEKAIPHMDNSQLSILMQPVEFRLPDTNTEHTQRYSDYIMSKIAPYRLPLEIILSLLVFGILLLLVNRASKVKNDAPG